MNPKLMGVVNVTPDSFSDGGRYLDADAAIAHGVELVRDGAAILDVGGESTRPGAEPVGAEEELRRGEPGGGGVGGGGPGAVGTSKGAAGAAALGPRGGAPEGGAGAPGGGGREAGLCA